jgi:formiminotetrahydrofolate cyclodeaminase
MLVDQTVLELLAAFSSPDPTPGGGSAAALSAATGLSLLRMVAALPKSRTGSVDERSALAAVSRTLADRAREATEAIDRDARAYEAVIAAYKLPKSSVEQKQARDAAVQLALRGATEVPLAVMRLSSQGLDSAVVVAANGHRPAASDVGVAVGLLRAAIEGARLNVDANLVAIADHDYVTRIKNDANKWRDQSARAMEAAAAYLLLPLPG